MPFLSTPDPLVATLTDLGRINFARSTIGEVSFVVDSFAVGRDGYQMANPVLVQPINTTLTTLMDQFFPISPATKPLEAIERPTPSTIIANCRLASNEGIAGLGEVGLWGKIVNSIVPAEINTTFLLAVAHMPLNTKTLKQAVVYRFIIQF